jgi:hypothetical protein
MTTSVQIVDISILRFIPEILAWAVGIVLAGLMVRRGGVKAEKLLLAGCSLMLFAGVMAVLLRGMMPSMREWSISAQEMGIIYSSSALPSLAGLICLIIAFWVRFRAKRQVSA